MYSNSLAKEEIVKRWERGVEESLYEDGHSYSGGIGMLGSKISRWYDKNFMDENDCYKFLSNTQEKWDPAIAVSFEENGQQYWMIGGWCSE